MYYQSMQQKTVTFRAPGDKIKALDSLAALQQRDRSFVLNEAVDQYLSLNEYHIALIKEGVRQADAGELVPHDEVRRRLAALMKPAARKLRKRA
jgi:predicted transcriptional regulator